MSKSGRVEKTVEGHRGAVLGVKWMSDGTALLTCETHPSTVIPIPLSPTLFHKPSHYPVNSETYEAHLFANCSCYRGVRILGVGPRRL